MTEMMSAPTFAAESAEKNMKFFAEADKNNDGMLDKDELKAYQDLWEAFFK